MRTHLAGLRARLIGHGRAALLIAVGALGGGAALAVASVPDSNGQIHVCYTVQSGTTNVPDLIQGNLSVIDPSDNQTCAAIKSQSGVPDQEVTFDQTGIEGPTGPQGVPGVQGTPGLKGNPGLQGPIGLQGLAGATGATGAKGTTGLQGLQGTGGTQGNPGQTGAPGQTGPAGQTGGQGSQGLAGAQGPAGGSGGVLAAGPQQVTTAIGQVVLKQPIEELEHSQGQTITFNPLSVTINHGAGPHGSHFTITKSVDSASPKLFTSATGATVFKTVKIVLYKANEQVPAVQYTLRNAVITSDEVTQHSGGGTETFVLAFTQIDVQTP